MHHHGYVPHPSQEYLREAKGYQINKQDPLEALAYESRLKVAKWSGKGRFCQGKNGVHVSRVRKWKIQRYASSMMQKHRNTWKGTVKREV